MTIDIVIKKNAKLDTAMALAFVKAASKVVK